RTTSRPPSASQSPARHVLWWTQPDMASSSTSAASTQLPSLPNAAGLPPRLPRITLTRRVGLRWRGRLPPARTTPASSRPGARPHEPWATAAPKPPATTARAPPQPPLGLLDQDAMAQPHHSCSASSPLDGGRRGGPQQAGHHPGIGPQGRHLAAVPVPPPSRLHL